MTVFGWGVLGTGAIARKFTAGLDVLPDAEVRAVGSRSADSAGAFAAEHGIQRAHGSYAELASDPDLDAVYVATPHSRHLEDALLCIEAGKAVLCEKPLTLNAAEGERMVAAARERGVFLMEAMWARFNPAVRALRGMLAEGALGEVRNLTCDFGFRTEFDPAGRLFDPALGGGALLDVGVYCVAFARMVFGRDPEAMTGLATIGETGVDEQCAFTFRYPDGALAVMSAAVRTDTAQEAIVSGTRSRVRLPHFWRADRMIVDGEERVFDVPGNGYHYEAAEVAACVRAGRLESEHMPLDETLAILRTMDALRADWGVRYPADG